MPLVIFFAVAVAALWGLDVAYALLLLGQGDPLILGCSALGVGLATLLPAALGHPAPGEGMHRTVTVGGYIALSVWLLLLAVGLGVPRG